ncbi:MAG: 30S ribosomal protein S16 [SAR202 cluster bacterium Io17-Chloro-G9]|nr:MAG: 30S ribosomal protein S16 [SAR202 cluster bacterium Io17-Chloro-G9]
MLRIRLRRVGKRGKPSYRIVVAESRAPRDGAYLEWIGNYDPMSDPPSITLKADRATEWLSKGAQPSDAVKRILHWNGLLEREPLQRTSQRKNEAKGPAAAPATATVTAVAQAPEAAVVEDAPVEAPVDDEPAEEAVEEQSVDEVVEEQTMDPPVDEQPAAEAVEEQPVEEDSNAGEASGEDSEEAE